MNSQRQGYEGWWQGGHRGWPADTVAGQRTWVLKML